MVLQDKINIFINRAQSKIVDLALLTADDLYEAFSDDTNIKLANELEDLVVSLQDPLLDWSNYEIELAIDYYTYKAELADLALVNYTQYGTYISTGSGNSGGSYTDNSWIDPFNSLSTRVNNNHNSTLSEIDRLDNRINNLDFSTIIPQSLLDDVEDNSQARHSHANKSILDSITNGHLESIAYNNDHRQNSTIHVTTTQKTRWDNKVSQSELLTGLSGKSDVGHTHPIPDIEGLSDFLDTLTPEKGDKGDPGVSPYIEIGTYEEGEELEISVDNTNPMFPKLNFVVPVAQDGKDFSIDVLGKAASRLKAIYTDEPLGYTYLGTDNGVLYFRRPFADDGVTPISATTSSGWYGVTFMGKDGWSPIIGTQNIDNDTVVLRLMGWIGGTSEMPTFGTDPNHPVYVGEAGFTYDLGQATNIRGRQGSEGEQGASGKIMFPDIADLYSNRYLYDDELKDTIFLDEEDGIIYRKLSDSSGDWSEGFQWKGDQGSQGIPGEKGEAGSGSGGGLASIAEESNDEIRAITEYEGGNDIFNYTTGSLYEYDSTETESDDDDNFLKPNNSTGSGRWVKRQDFAKKSDLKFKTYSIDFGLHTVTAQEINLIGAATISNVVFSNIDSVKLTWSGGLQQLISEGINNIEVIQNDILTWEIEKINANELSSLGIQIQTQ